MKTYEEINLEGKRLKDGMNLFPLEDYTFKVGSAEKISVTYLGSNIFIQEANGENYEFLKKRKERDIAEIFCLKEDDFYQEKRKFIVREEILSNPLIVRNKQALEELSKIKKKSLGALSKIEGLGK